jgi:4-amino-4-deoxy-L-arabinose transferase-like glycosyltransferase
LAGSASPLIGSDRTSRFVLATGVGLATLSLLTLACGLLGMLERRLLIGIPAAALACELALWWRAKRSSTVDLESSSGQPTSSGNSGRVLLFPLAVIWLIGCVAILFLFFQFAGASLPSIDFDVKEYHLQGPREFFEQGRITRLPHNVYTSFPFLTEMLSLAGMVVADDWWWGALVGKSLLAAFAPLTALTLFAAGRRWWSTGTGLAAAMIYLTIPWTTRVLIIAYTEGGLCFYLAATLLAVSLAVERTRSSEAAGGAWLLAGLLAGSGMACKYTGLVQVVIPASVALVASIVVARGAWPLEKRTEANRAGLRMAALFGLGVALTIGPWLLKNLVETGNPVYPLGYTLFGGEDWGEPDNIKWRAAHSSSDYSPSSLAGGLLDVVSRNDWQSPLVFGLAPLAVLVSLRRRQVACLWLLVAWLFVSWWGLTHRLDRFWVPILPVVSLLAGIGLTWCQRPAWWRPCAVVVVLGLAYNIAVVTVTSPRSVIGYNAFLGDLDMARKAAATTAPAVGAVNEWLDEQAGVRRHVLCVGEAQVFDARFPVHYNTVFDRSLLEEWCGDGRGGLADVKVIRERLVEHDVGWVLVNWQEILRYRTTYGYTEFVTPELFGRLREMGVLGEDEFDRKFLLPTEGLSERTREQIDNWGRRLKRVIERDQRRVGGYVGVQLFRVK